MCVCICMCILYIHTVTTFKYMHWYFILPPGPRGPPSTYLNVVTVYTYLSREREEGKYWVCEENCLRYLLRAAAATGQNCSDTNSSRQQGRRLSPIPMDYHSSTWHFRTSGGISHWDIPLWYPQWYPNDIPNDIPMISQFLWNNTV